ncbi:MAG: leucine-rich repeat protein [bacterium]
MGIKSETFLMHYKVEKITIPDTVEYIEDSAFSICTNLKSINIPKGVTIIKESTFAGCSE